MSATARGGASAGAAALAVLAAWATLAAAAPAPPAAPAPGARTAVTVPGVAAADLPDALSQLDEERRLMLGRIARSMPDQAAAAKARRRHVVPAILPIAGAELSTTFGARGPHWAVAHSGLDFSATLGTPALAVVDAVVASVFLHPAYGIAVALRRADGTEFWYCHLSRVLVRPGQKVLQGDSVALTGATGNVTGPHLHFEVRVDGVPTDPADFLARTPGSPGPIPDWARAYQSAAPASADAGSVSAAEAAGSVPGQEAYKQQREDAAKKQAEEEAAKQVGKHPKPKPSPANPKPSASAPPGSTSATPSHSASVPAQPPAESSPAAPTAPTPAEPVTSGASPAAGQ